MSCDPAQTRFDNQTIIQPHRQAGFSLSSFSARHNDLSSATESQEFSFVQVSELGSSCVPVSASQGSNQVVADQSQGSERQRYVHSTSVSLHQDRCQYGGMGCSVERGSAGPVVSLCTLTFWSFWFLQSSSELVLSRVEASYSPRDG